MNFIKKLQEEKAELKARIRQQEDSLTYWMKYLASDKFQGVENNFVNAQEMYQAMVAMRNEIGTP